MKALIGVDFSKSSVAASDWVARWFLPDAPLGLAYCIDVPSSSAFSRVHDEGHDVILERAKEEAGRALLPLAQEFGPDRTEAMVGVGSPADALLELAEGWGANVIAIGPHGHSPFLTGFFGSTASQLIRRSPLPVLVVREAGARLPERILIAIDERPVTARVLEVAKDVLAICDCDVTGFYDFEVFLEGLPSFSGPSGDVDLEVGIKDTAGAWLKEVLVDAGIPRRKTRTEVGNGPAGAAICRAAEDGDVDLIIMGTYGKPLAGPTFGSVARYVVGHAPCPVLVVPEGR